MEIKQEVQNIIDRLDIEVGFGNVKAKMIYTSNPRFNYYVGRLAKLGIRGLIATFEDWHSSYVWKIELQDGTITFTTRNSIYSFKILEDEFLEWFNQGIIFELTDKEKRILEDWIRG